VKGIGIAEYDIRKYAKAFTDSKIRSGDWRNPPKNEDKKEKSKKDYHAVTDPAFSDDSLVSS
jgi:hypothetical protein